jgi:hypothetical protein
MSGPPSASLPRTLAACLGMAAFVAVLVWGLGAGLAMEAALLRAAGGGALMFLIGLILGRAMTDTLEREVAPPPEPEKKKELSRKGP